MAGVKDIRAAAERAGEARKESGRRTVLFLDEVHRFNKAQQDAFLPWVEDGTLVFIGATTENPSFELNTPCCPARGFTCLRALTEEDLRQVLDRALDRSVANGTCDRSRRTGADTDRTRGGWRRAARTQHARAVIRSGG
jgi:putative ATPase